MEDGEMMKEMLQADIEETRQSVKWRESYIQARHFQMDCERELIKARAAYSAAYSAVELARLSTKTMEIECEEHWYEVDKKRLYMLNHCDISVEPAA